MEFSALGQITQQTELLLRDTLNSAVEGGRVHKDSICLMFTLFQNQNNDVSVECACFFSNASKLIRHFSSARYLF